MPRMKAQLPAQIEALFLRCPALCGFSVRTDEESDLYVDDVGISPAVSREQCGEILREIVVALAQLIAEEPEADAVLRGRTFARVLH
jgi:hypothetical protein